MSGPAPFCAAVDWGTSSFRLWLLAEDGRVLAERRSDEGLISAGAGRGFEAVLEAHLQEVEAAADLPVTMCGMVGSRSGWVEADYLDAPVRLGGIGARATIVAGLKRRIAILPGIAQRSEERPDVMRGEETKILGLGRDADGLVLMPGTHTKWARLAEGAIIGFSTFMTGEIFALLSQSESSVLRGAVAGAEAVDPRQPAFAGGVRDSLATPALTTSRLFGLRAGWLTADWAPDHVLGRLSGLLIGLEIAGARERHGRLGELNLVAAGPIGDLYAAALEVAGVEDLRRKDADACVRAGLLRAAKDALVASGGEAR